MFFHVGDMATHREDFSLSRENMKVNDKIEKPSLRKIINIIKNNIKRRNE